MPCFRGIDVFIGTESELERLPEFPHPDSASVSLIPRVQPASSPESQSSSAPSTPEGSPASITKVNPRVSVYIPSLPGIRFWIQYSITQASAPSSHLYFKLFASGINVANWGIDPAKTTTGTVARGLYEPGESWHYQDEAGAVLKRDGIESRLFQFSESSDDAPLAEDGGIIEVQVFRAKGRRRCAPRLEQCGNLDECGILFPSGGLLEHPEDAAFYDWLLLDPKESPYATFRFYYRTWARLRCLNVIPPSRTSGSPGLFPYGGLEGAPTTPPLSKRSPEPKFDVGRPPVEHHDTSEKDEKKESSGPGESPSKGPRIQFPLTNPPEVLQARSSSPCLPQPSKKTRDGFLDRGPSRPLPALPSRPSRLKKPSLDVPAPTINPENPLGQDTSQDASGMGVNRVIPSPVFPPGPLTPPPLSLSPSGNRKKQDECSSPPSPEAKAPRRFSPPPKLSPSPKGAVTQQTREAASHQPRSPSPLSKHRDGSHTSPQSPSCPKPVTEKSVDPSQSPPKLSSPGRRTSPPRFELGGNGIPALPRGLLGPALTEIPLRGPTGELMKKLRSEDPFRDD